MSKIVAIMNMPGATQAQYDAVMAELQATGAAAMPGGLGHIAMPTADGWMVIDLWESADKLQAFGAMLAPILIKHGVKPPVPVVQPIHNMFFNN